MNAVKQMSYEQKYKTTQENIELFKTFVPSFIEKNLGSQHVYEYEMLCQEGTKAILEETDFEKKYEAAYENFIWIGKSNFSFIRNHMGENGLIKFEAAEVKALKQKNAGPADLILKLIRTFSPGRAFLMTNKEFSYQLQWLTPFSVPELSKDRAVFDIPSCKILDFEDTEDICHISCQKVYPTWVADQFKVKMQFDRKDAACKCTVTPLL